MLFLGSTSNPAAPTLFFIFFAGVAQLVERLICNQSVMGSSPVTSLHSAHEVGPAPFLCCSGC